MDLKQIYEFNFKNSVVVHFIHNFTKQIAVFFDTTHIYAISNQNTYS